MLNHHTFVATALASVLLTGIGCASSQKSESAGESADTAAMGMTSDPQPEQSTASSSQAARTPEAPAVDMTKYERSGFHTSMHSGVLWVIPTDSSEYEQFKSSGYPARSVTRVGAGPGGVSIRAFDADHITAYLASKPGFHTSMNSGVLWVIPTDSSEYEQFQSSGYPARSVTRIGAGPGGVSIRAFDADHIDLYLAR